MSLPSMEHRTFDWVFIGNEHPIKGIKELKEFIACRVRMNGDEKYAIVGNIKPFTKYAEFFGVVTGEQKEHILLNSQCLYLPSLHESFSMVMVEAMRCGCLPVVEYRLLTIESVYKKGWVYYDELPVDDWTKMSQEAYEESLRFNWETEARKVLK